MQDTTAGCGPMMAPDGWQQSAFHALSVQQLYAILQLRQQVFVVEQTCAYLDSDGLDESAIHLWRVDKGALVACARCLPPGVPYPNDSSIGRIVVAPSQRGRDLGRELVRRSIALNRERWPNAPIKIGAQARLRSFYEEFGFTACGPIYDEDGIDHLPMRLPAPAGG